MGAMSQENVEIVRSVFEPLEGVNVAAIDWDVEGVREVLGAPTRRTSS